MRPDMTTDKDRMARTFSWRQREIMEGMSEEDVLNKYPFLKISTGYNDEVDRIHPSTNGFCQRFREGFASVLLNVLKLAQGKSPLAKLYTDAREDALSEDLPGIDMRAGTHPFAIHLQRKDRTLYHFGRGCCKTSSNHSTDE